MDSKPESPTEVQGNKGEIVGQKAPLTLQDIGTIRIGLQRGHRARELALIYLPAHEEH